MWRNMIETAGGRPVLGTPFVGLLGSQIIAETASGVNGAGLMFNDGLDPNKRYRLLLADPTNFPGTVDENGALFASASVNTTYALYEDNILVVGGGAVPLSVTIGSTVPAVVTQPTSRSVIAPAAATFSYGFNYVTAVQAQRRANSSSPWVDVAGATLTGYTTPPTSDGETAEYRFGGTGPGGGPVYTNVVALAAAAPARLHMEQFNEAALTPLNGALALITDATVTVKIAGTNLLATIYDGAVEKDNPFIASVYGEIQFHAPDGLYDVYIDSPQRGSVVLEDVSLMTPNSPIYIDDSGEYIDRKARITTLRDVVDPVGIVPNNWHVVTGNGDNATFRGVSGGYFKARDRDGITANQRGVLYGAQFSIEPHFIRNNAPYDDAVGAVFQNEGSASGTEFAYFAHNPALTAGHGDVSAVLGVDAWATVLMYGTGQYTWLFDALWAGRNAPARFLGGMLRGPNNTAMLTAQSADNSVDYQLVKLNSVDNPEFFGQEMITVRDMSPAPVIGSDTGPPSSATLIHARWSKYNRRVFFKAALTVTTKGGATYIRIPLPVAAGQFGCNGAGKDLTSGALLAVDVAGSGTYARVTTAAGGDPLVDGHSYSIEINYEVPA